MKTDHSLRYPTGALLDLQLRVARRADELARTRESPTLLNLHCWMLAETEIFNVESPLNGALPRIHEGDARISNLV